MLGFWYLLAYDLEDEKIKTFYIKSITDLTVLNESYLSEQEMQALSDKTSSITSPWFTLNEKKVLLRVTDDAMLYLKRQNNSKLKVVEENSSELLIEMSYYNDIEVLTFVKRWLPFITIEDDETLKQKLQNILETSLKNYTS